MVRTETITLRERFRQDPLQAVLLVLIFGFLVLLFHFQGNATDIRLFGTSVFGWMLSRWSDATISVADYSHGWLIPLVSLFIFWSRRKEMLQARTATDWRGLWLVTAALLMHWAGMRAQQPRLSLMAFILLLWGVPFLLYGFRVARLLIFPCAYLVFCIPLNFLDSLTFPLRLFATVLSTGLLNGLGIAAVQSGTAIFSSAGGGFNFDVANPCSGIRYLLALSALTAAYANLSQKSLWKQWGLFAASVPLAVAGNVARIVLIALAAHFFGQDAAMGLYHNYSGLIVFSVAVLLMVAIGRGLKALSTPNRQHPTPNAHIRA